MNSQWLEVFFLVSGFLHSQGKGSRPLLVCLVGEESQVILWYEIRPYPEILAKACVVAYNTSPCVWRVITEFTEIYVVLLLV